MEINLGFALLLTALAGLSTGIGSAVAYFIRTPKSSYLSLMLGFSAGVMTYISFAELLKTSIDEIGFGPANLAFFVGIAFIAAVDMAIPHDYEEEREGEARLEGVKPKGLMRAGVFAALGIAIHNFPEGVVTFASAATGDTTLGIAVAIAVAIHNIPEGMAVSVPVYYASGSRKKAFLYSFSSGLAEPVGALIAYAILLPFLTPALLSASLAFVAGVMVYISLDELLPMAHKYGRSHLVISGVGAGMLVMAVSLFLLG